MIDGTDILRNHEALEKRLVASIQRSAEKAKQILVENIQEKLQQGILRPNESNGTLSRAIATSSDVLNLPKTILIGIGSVGGLDLEAPYWYLIEEGGMVSDKAQRVGGYFVFGADQVPFDKSRKGPPSFDMFVQESHSGSMMTVMEPIPPHYYFRDGELKARDDVLNMFVRDWGAIWA